LRQFLQRFTFPDMHPRLAELLSVFGADAIPSRLLELDRSSVMLLDASFGADASNCWIAVWRRIAVGVNPLDLAQGIG
jgi:hypothetical protein